MDPALWEELLWAEEEADGDRVLEAIIRLAQPGIEIPDVRIVSRFGPIATCRIRARDVIAVRARPEVISLKAPRGLSPGFEPAVGPPGSALLGQRPTDVRRSPTLALTGAGVVVACVDWGVDVDSAAFRWPDDPVAAGDHRPGGTRLLSFWDQRDLARGPRPDPYGYGAIHSREEIDRALEDPRPYERLGYHPAIADPRGRGTHGTRTLDIAAGNGRADGPAGIAPDADLVFVHLADRNTGGLANFGDSGRLLEAVDFISRTAGPQPCVINISAGRICGPHDGTALVERALDELLAAVPGRFVVNSAGNYFHWRAHSCGTIAPGEARSLTFVTDPADSTLNQLEVWYDGADEFAVRIDPPGYAESRPVYLGERAGLLVEGKVVGRVYHRKHDPNNGDNHIVAYLDPIGCTGNWTVTLEARRVSCGRFHAWIERDDSCRDCQARFTHDDSNPAITIGSIATSHLPLIVGAYNGHDPARPVAPFSSAGPSRDGRTKPDLAAPGVSVLTARSAPIGASRNPGLLVRGNGTSFATPHVTGAVALCLEAAGNRLSAHKIRSLVLGSCDPVPDADPQHRLGHGYLNIPRLVADVQRTLTTPTTAPSPQEPTMDTEDTIVLLAAAPATAYREYLYRPDGQLARWIGSRYEVVARPGERANRALQRGDVLIEVALGQMGGGRCVTLDEPELEAMGSQLRLPQGQFILRPLPRVEMSESMPVEPASEAEGVGLERLIGQGLSENQITNALFYARHPTQSGSTLQAGTNAAREWHAIRDTEVRPGVRQRLVVSPVDPVQLAVFLSQYENDARVPEEYTKRFLTGTPLLTMGRTVRDRVIGNWRNGGPPLSASGLYQLALQTAGDPGTAALLCHNVTKAFVREGVAITWRGTGTEGEYTDGQQTHRARVINPAGRLKYYHAAKKRDVISIFYLLFSAEEFGTDDPGDWYHYFVTATMTALASGGTLGGTTGRGRREDVDSDAEERGGRVGAVAYRELLSDRLHDLERQMTDRALASVPGYRGWVLANVLSFLEGGHYGADYTTGQSDVVRESKVHLRGAAFGLRTIGGSPGKTWRWYVPVAGSLSEADLATGFNLKTKTAEVWGPDAKPAVGEAADSDAAFGEGHDSGDQAAGDVDEDWRGDLAEADAGEAAWAAFTPPPPLATEDAPGTPIPVVLVPGIMGTRLVDPATQAKVWNPTGRRFAADTERLNNMAPLLPDPTPDNVPFYTPWINESAAAIPGFGNLVWEVGGQLALQLASPAFQRRALEVTGAPVRVWVAGYDWRQDNRRSAEALARVVDVALRQTGASRVVIVAHSMGGLVSRWFCRFGGADKVAALVLLGTPTHGTPQAYRALKVGLERWVGDFFAWAVFPLSWPGGRLRMLRRFPSAFQLLPTAAYCAHDRGWLAFGPTASGITDAADPVALYRDPTTGFLEGPDPTVEAHLAAREQFDRALGSFMPDPTYVLFSDRLPTEARYTLAARGPNVTLELGPMGHGDGTVVRYSGSAEGSALGRGLRLPVGAVSHKALPDYPPIIATVQTIVLRTRRPAAAPVTSHEAVMQLPALVATADRPYRIGGSPSPAAAPIPYPEDLSDDVTDELPEGLAEDAPVQATLSQIDDPERYTDPAGKQDVAGSGTTRRQVHDLEFGIVGGFKEKYPTKDHPEGSPSVESRMTKESPDKMAVVIMPDHFDAARPVQVVVHFHGWGFRGGQDPYAGYLVASGDKGGAPGSSRGTVRDVDQEHWEQQIGAVSKERATAEDHGPQIIAILAQGRGPSEFGGDPLPVFEYVQDVLSKVKELKGIKQYSIVLSAHSGGGNKQIVPMVQRGYAEMADRVRLTDKKPGSDPKLPADLVVLFDAEGIEEVMEWVTSRRGPLRTLVKALKAAATPADARAAIAATPKFRGYFAEGGRYAKRYGIQNHLLCKELAKVPEEWTCCDPSDRTAIKVPDLFRIIQVSGVVHEQVISGGPKLPAKAGTLAQALRASLNPTSDRAKAFGCSAMKPCKPASSSPGRRRAPTVRHRDDAAELTEAEGGPQGSWTASDVASQYALTQDDRALLVSQTPEQRAADRARLTKKAKSRLAALETAKRKGALGGGEEQELADLRALNERVESSKRALGRKDVEDVLAQAHPPSTVAQWFGDIQKGTFLGLPLRVHRALAARLSRAEATLVGDPKVNPTGLSAAELGRRLGMYASTSDLRKPAKAVGGTSLSMHTFGLAVDLNITGNPFIGNVSTLVPDVLRRATRFVNGTAIDVLTHLADPKVAYATLKRASDALKTYFSYRDPRKRSELATKVAGRTPAKGEPTDVPAWLEQLEKDHAALSASGDFEKHKPPDQGFLDLHEAVVLALTGAGLTWGGTYPGAKDLMHFDLREAEGAAVNKARRAHEANV